MDATTLISKEAAGETKERWLAELLIRNPRHVDGLLRDPARAAALVPRFIAIGFGALVLFGITESLILGFSGIQLPRLPRVAWGDGSAAYLVPAYALGFFAACAICLPSFYFYGLLAGLRLSFLQVTARALHGMAVTGVVLVGLLPVALALALGPMVFDLDRGTKEIALSLGLLFPFVAGLWGVRAIYRGLAGLEGALRPGFEASRGVFLLRLILLWAGVFTATTPVMVYTLWWQFVGR